MAGDKTLFERYFEAANKTASVAVAFHLQK